MTTSSSNHRELAMMVVQSGIVAWEDPAPIPDWRFKTVTLVSKRLVLIAELLRNLVESHVHGIERFFRLVLTPMPPSLDVVQTRRLISKLSANPPGFSETKLTISSDFYRITSELQDIRRIDIEYLTQYRQCVLVGATSGEFAAGNVPIGWSNKSRFGGDGLLSLFATDEIILVLRVLDMESHAVLQVIGHAKSCDKVSSYFDDMEVRRVHDVRNISEEIRQLLA